MTFMINEQADRALNSAMDELESQLRRAESRFESDGRSLEIKSQYSICNDMSVLADILSESRRITDELYASYEALIRAANSICKPFADEGVYPSTLNRVVKFMKHINSECSTLGSNFSASVDSYSLGNVASTRYSPSSEARMIETNWGLLHSMHPQVAEEKRLAEERAAKLRAEREERERIERERAIEEYPQKLAAWEAEHERVVALRNKLIPEAQEKAKKKLQSEMKAHFAKCVGERERAIAEQHAVIAGCQATIQGAKFFQFGKKIEANQRMLDANQRLATENAALAELQARGPEREFDYGRKLEKALSQAQSEVERANPLPSKPQDPSQARSSSYSGSITGLTATQIANNSVKDAIYEMLLDSGSLMTIPEIQETCPACCDLTNQRISALVRQLVSDGRVERVEDRRVAYFKAVEGYSSSSSYESSSYSSSSSSSYSSSYSSSSYGSSSSYSSVSSANEGIKAAIYDFIKAEGRPVTITEVMEGCPACADLTNQRCSALIRQLVSDGEVIRTEQYRKAYFEAR